MTKTERIPTWPLWDETHRHLETFNQYLERMHLAGYTEFRVAIRRTDEVVLPCPMVRFEQRGHDVRFIIHPLNRDGDTAEFVAPRGTERETSPGMTAFNVEPIGHGGYTFEEWAVEVRKVARHDEDDGNLYDFFAEGYAVGEMPKILCDRYQASLKDDGWD